MTLLVLFDIDGTLLLRAASAHAEALHAAIRQVYGVDPEGVHVDPAGRTDLEIARIILLDRDVDARTIDMGLLQMREVAVREYAEREADLRDHVAPGAVDLLERLQADDAVLSLVTGNLEPIARLKLKRAGLDHWFARGQGGFGSDSEDRTHLPGLARRRAGAVGHPWPVERTVVIGDTPRDIICARADGVRCAAVATGRYSIDDLAGADAVAPSLAELAPALEAWM
jgi:phosphoglycolate phosphatase-like HAD superfamily hydrolase